MKFLSIIISGLLALIIATAPATVVAQEPPSSAWKQEQLAKLQKAIDKSNDTALVNQGWDTTFKVGLLILALVAVGISGYISGQVTPGTWPKIGNVVVTGTIAAASAFSNTQMEFSKRQAVWRERAVQLDVCKDLLSATSPTPQQFTDLVGPILAYGDRTSLSDLKASCVSSKSIAQVSPKSVEPAASPVVK